MHAVLFSVIMVRTSNRTSDICAPLFVRNADEVGDVFVELTTFLRDEFGNQQLAICPRSVQLCVANGGIRGGHDQTASGPVLPLHEIS